MADVSEWQPIDTWHDGCETTVIYALPHPRRPGGWSVGVMYRSVSNTWNDSEGGWLRINPTHWMPLPSAPDTEGKS